MDDYVSATVPMADVPDDGNRMRLYWDAEEVAFAFGSGPLVTDADELNIGRFGTAGFHFAVEVRETFVSSRTITRPRVTHLHGGGYRLPSRYAAGVPSVLSTNVVGSSAWRCR